jgi:hypothetical protein
VADPWGDFYTSNIMAAYDYAFRMGAHIVSNSFGPESPTFNPTAWQKEDAINQNRLYERAIKPLSDKGVLLVAAAGAWDGMGGAGRQSTSTPRLADSLIGWLRNQVAKP